MPLQQTLVQNYTLLAYFGEKFAHFGSVLLPQLFLIFHILISAHAIPHSSRSLTSIESSQNGGDRETARGPAVTDGARADRFTGTHGVLCRRWASCYLTEVAESLVNGDGDQPCWPGEAAKREISSLSDQCLRCLCGNNRYSIRKLHKIFLGETVPVSEFPKGDTAITVFPLKCDFVTVGQHLRTHRVSQNWPTLQTFRESM